MIIVISITLCNNYIIISKIVEYENVPFSMDIMSIFTRFVYFPNDINVIFVIRLN